MFSVWFTTDGDKQMGSDQLLFSFRSANGQLNLRPILLYPDSFRVKQNSDAVLGHHLEHRFRNVRVLASQKLIGALYDRDITPESSKHLAELQTDVAAAQHQ